MNTLHTSFKHAAARGALVVGASWLGSGITPEFRVVDSSRRGFRAFVDAINPAALGGAANTLFAAAFTGL